MSLHADHARELRRLEERERSLAVRGGTLVLATLFFAVAAAIALPASLRATERTELLALAAAPLAIAVALVVPARAALRDLGAVRSRRRAVLFEIAGVPPSAGEKTITAVHQTAERSAP